MVFVKRNQVLKEVKRGVNANPVNVGVLDTGVLDANPVVVRDTIEKLLVVVERNREENIVHVNIV